MYALKMYYSLFIVELKYEIKIDFITIILIFIIFFSDLYFWYVNLGATSDSNGW